MYADFVCAREGHAQDIKPKDPRTEEDKIASIQLLKANKDKIKQGKLFILPRTLSAPPPLPSPYEYLRLQSFGEIKVSCQNSYRNKSCVHNIIEDTTNLVLQSMSSRYTRE